MTATRTDPIKAAATPCSLPSMPPTSWGEQGRDATVRLIDAAGQPVAAWTYGTDPYPPVLFLDAT
jgi:hypothetical protein